MNGIPGLLYHHANQLPCIGDLGFIVVPIPHHLSPYLETHCLSRVNDFNLLLSSF